jgi:hypothetical protein
MQSGRLVTGKNNEFIGTNAQAITSKIRIVFMD